MRSRTYNLREVCAEVAKAMCPSSRDVQQNCAEHYYRVCCTDYGARSRYVLREIPLSTINTEIPSDEPSVVRYAAQRRAGSPFPPIFVPDYNPFGAFNYPVDGMHRVRAAKVVGDESIAAFIPASKKGRF